MNRTRVFLVDDHSVLRQGLKMLIDRQSDMEVVGQSDRAREAIEDIRAVGGAEVVVLDVSMPDMMGFDVAAGIRHALPASKIIALTRHSEKAYIHQMLQNGASGYVLKQTSADVLLNAIRVVYSGGTFIDPAIAAKVVESGAKAPRGASPDALSVREREVLQLVAFGHTNKEIASLLGITVKTVETHKTNAMQRLELTSRAELVRFALSQGWLQR